MRRAIGVPGLVLGMLWLGCGPTNEIITASPDEKRVDAGPTDHGGGNSNGGGSDGGSPGTGAGCNSDPDRDGDGDGFTPAQGDCDDCNPTINPAAIQIPGDPTDYACNGKPGVLPSCDIGLAGKRDPSSLAQAFDQCDPRFFKGAMMVGPSDARARKVVGKFGVVQPRGGKAMTLISNGIAADKSDPDFDFDVEEDPGTDLGHNNQFQNPLPNLPGTPGCGQTQPPTVNDYTELVVKLKAPSNASSLSFDFQFLSAEYPVFVCTEFNDEFLILQESHAEFAKPTNIAFDLQKNPITVNSGFFTVCTNDPYKPQTQHCLHPVGGIQGTGFDDPALPGGFDPNDTPPDANIPGGSTGWLTTTSPVSPNEEVTLHFIVFDEGDHVLDSAALIDNFRWGTTVVASPMTIPIQ